MGRREFESRADVPARFAARAATALIRIRLGSFSTHHRPLASLAVAWMRENGPARIRIAVTATRRPKDTKLPHRPAPRGTVRSVLTFPSRRALDPQQLLHGEVAVPVMVTAGIERSTTVRTAMLTVEIRSDRKPRATATAKHGRFVEARRRPPARLVLGKRFVTLDAGVERFTARQRDGHDIAFGPVVPTARFAVDLDAADRHVACVADRALRPALIGTVGHQYRASPAVSSQLCATVMA